MNFKELVLMKERHREEILSLLSPMDDDFLKNICLNNSRNLEQLRRNKKLSML